MQISKQLTTYNSLSGGGSPERIMKFPGGVDGMGAGREVWFLVARPGPGLYACGACVVRSGIHNHSG